jgi:hypothetical protein
MENRYQLMTFGIPVGLIPLTDSGTVKTKQLNQWIKSRKAIEDALMKQRRDPNNINNKVLIECPLSTDVVFRNGTSSLVHPGNSKFRELISTHFEQHTNGTPDEKLAITWKILDHVTKNGRFLEWDRTNCCWTPIVDRSQMRIKVALTLRDFKKIVQAARNKQTNASGTTKFLDEGQADDKKRKRMADYGEENSDCQCDCSPFGM